MLKSLLDFNWLKNLFWSLAAKEKTQDTKCFWQTQKGRGVSLQVVQLSLVSSVSWAAEPNQPFAISTRWPAVFSQVFLSPRQGAVLFPAEPWYPTALAPQQPGTGSTATTEPGWARSFGKWLPWGRGCFYSFLSICLCWEAGSCV